MLTSSHAYKCNLAGSKTPKRATRARTSSVTEASHARTRGPARSGSEPHARSQAQNGREPHARAVKHVTDASDARAVMLQASNGCEPHASAA